MNTKQSISRPELLNIFKDLQEKFNSSQEQDEIFKQECNKFQNNMSQHLAMSEKNVAKDNPLSQPIKDFIKVFKENNQNWQKKIDAQDTGVHFRAGFNDSLLVFVYGKVKSGKSSLGNYMAWGYTDPTEQQKCAIPEVSYPHYFSEKKTEVKGGDVAKEAEIKKEFRVGATEATSSIQGFSLEGLTWVDSPGLHSINQENGDLAKEYVEHADLILYTMKSDSPARESDLREILELYRADKKVLLLLTGSDDIENDWDDEKDELISKVVMKSSQRRLDQQEYVRSALEQFPELAGKTENIEILSFSARYAQEYEDNAENFADSGMGQLFATLGQIASADGVKLKYQTPMKKFKNFLVGFLTDLQKYTNLVYDFQQPIERIEKSIPRQINEQKRLIQLELTKELDIEFEQLAQYRNEPVKMNLAIKQLTHHLAQKQNQHMGKAKEIILQQVMNEFDSEIVTVIQNSALLNLPEFKIEQRTEKVADSVNQGTRTRNGGFGALIGGGLGAVAGSFIPGAGTIAGATVGSAIGGWLGGKTGDDASVSYRDITLNVGDNLTQIYQKFCEIVDASIQKQMDDFQKMVLSMALDDANRLIMTLEKEIQYFQQQLNNMIQEVEEKLN